MQNNAVMGLVSPDPASCPLALCPLAMSFHAGSQEQGGSLGFSSQDGREWESLTWLEERRENQREQTTKIKYFPVFPYILEKQWRLTNKKSANRMLSVIKHKSLAPFFFLSASVSKIVWVEGAGEKYSNQRFACLETPQDSLAAQMYVWCFPGSQWFVQHILPQTPKPTTDIFQQSFHIAFM